MKYNCAHSEKLLRRRDRTKLCRFHRKTVSHILIFVLISSVEKNFYFWPFIPLTAYEDDWHHIEPQDIACRHWPQIPLTGHMVPLPERVSPISWRRSPITVVFG